MKKIDEVAEFEDEESHRKERINPTPVNNILLDPVLDETRQKEIAAMEISKEG